MALKYYRLIDLIGTEGYERLRNAKILLVGVGAIGSEIAKNLTILGVKRLTLVDRDHVEMSNLALSFLYSEEDAQTRRKKAVAAAEKLRNINPDVKVEAIPHPVEEIDKQHFNAAHITILAVDNDATRLRVNSYYIEEKFNSYLIDCGAHGLRAEVTTTKPPETGCLRCVSLLKESAWHPCLPSHIFNPQKFIDYVEIAKIQFYEERNELLDPDNPEHIHWIFNEVNKKQHQEDREEGRVKAEIKRLLKHPIRFYPSTSIRAAAFATKKARILASLSKSEIERRKDSIFTQVKLLGNKMLERPVTKKVDCPQCGTGQISLLVSPKARLQELIQKLKTDYGLLNPRVWNLDGELIFDSPKSLSKTEKEWVEEILPKKIRAVGIKDGSILLVRSNVTDKVLECEVSMEE
ncbi:MAG: hypothetical protein GWO20_07405 [Candidatus Korarchaeota archaeon]|nr:hypothetical protein [Candidatus Korarchaeota archaeon]NIU83274.1 hypothetical protein [Candidatus Thorarchaeota archaeon]NIW13618.1 hypothetical protein [Candidatus Thorarchaeota archaeon]NIW51714.1 hypothetical protein [Candidatus Korarchaeota archaeon]